MRRKNDEEQLVKEEARKKINKLKKTILEELEKSIYSGKDVSEKVRKFKNLSKDLMSRDLPAAGGDLPPPRQPVYIFGNDSPPPKRVGPREGFGVFPKRSSSISDYPLVDSEVRPIMEPRYRASTPERKNRPFASSIRSGYAAIGDLTSQEPGYYLKPDEPDESRDNIYDIINNSQ